MASHDRSSSCSKEARSESPTSLSPTYSAHQAATNQTSIVCPVLLVLPPATVELLFASIVRQANLLLARATASVCLVQQEPHHKREVVNAPSVMRVSIKMLKVSRSARTVVVASSPIRLALLTA